MAGMTVIGILLILAVLLIGLGFVIKHRDRVFADKPVSEPPPKLQLPWTPWDVVLRACLGLWCIAAWVFRDDVPGLPPSQHPYTVAGVAYRLIAYVPFVVIGTVIVVRDRRRRKDERARREATESDPREGIDP